ncbi:sterol-sensing domain of SREBP cleavage-activation-domain-containing protein [Paraphysoderma sedebokerense]|nr:sterol-sensing domain of SREBP cleavage-activation-domain-containing protein [Paraphysoderma sedebokerense]
MMEQTTSTSLNERRGLHSRADHESGRCVMYGQCGKKSFFGKPLNCPSDTLAVPPSDSFRERLVETCGNQYASTNVCCDESQFDSLKQSLELAYNFVNSCPACWKNFKTFWCEFTCNPNQSTFVNVTSTAMLSNKKKVVDGVDYYVNAEFGTKFFRSCEEIKFGSDNRFAMEFIGGGATNYKEFFKFMGQVKPIGSPFAINFPESVPPTFEMTPVNPEAISCNSSIADYRCSCVDCSDTCPTLEPISPPSDPCMVGNWPCVTVVSSIIYMTLVISFLLYLFIRFISNGKFVNYLFGYRPIFQEEIDDSPFVEQEEFDRSSAVETPPQKKRRYFMSRMLEAYFYKHGRFCARHPYLTIFMSLAFVCITSIGWYHNLNIETDPVNLWVGPNSDSATQKHFFDENFSPFYRTTQLILTPENISDSIIQKPYILQLFQIQGSISALTTPSGVTLNDLCFQPLKNVQECVIESVTGYWQNNMGDFEDTPEQFVMQKFQDCTTNPASLDCLPPFQQVLRPDLVLGGVPSVKLADGKDFKLYNETKAFVVTFVNRNYVDDRMKKKAEEWEVLVTKFLGELKEGKINGTKLEGLNLSFSTESSIEIELEKSTSADIPTILISYVSMLLYASLALGRGTKIWEIFQHRRNFSRILVESKFLLGIAGIFIVLCSVSSSVGILSFFGVKATYIIAEVIPFLVLAIGVDNIFILLNEFDRIRHTNDTHVNHLPAHFQAATALSKVGPSILLSSLSEAVAFAIGGLVDMPAVSSFSKYAAAAILVDFMLQVTCFVSFMALDARKVEASRMDCFPCFQVPRYVEGSDGANSQDDQSLRPRDVGESWRFRKTGLEKFLVDSYTPFILHPVNRKVILGFTFLTTLLAASYIPEIELGLDQRIALPSDSYLIPYFNDLDRYFQVGPPVYFVVSGVDVTSREGQQKLCSRFPQCDMYSVPNVLEIERKRENVSFIAQPVASWIDDFFSWLNPSTSCCLVQPTNSSVFCDETDDPNNCQPCIDPTMWKTSNMDMIPTGQEFMRFLRQFLEAVPDADCPFAGSAAYREALKFSNDSSQVLASHFRTYHSPLQSQRAFIQSFQASHRISNTISLKNNISVFPYSIFYVFFEQYNSIVNIAWQTILLSMLAVSIITYIILGSLISAVILLGTIGLMVVLNVGLVLGLWGVSLNAVSVVNLVMGVGLSVEFCSHVLRGYLISPGSRTERVTNAMMEIGSSVFTGIGLTKVVGVTVLAFAKSRLFLVYYFRMYVGIVVIGLTIGLCVLPIILSYIGDPDVVNGDDLERTGEDDSEPPSTTADNQPEDSDPKIISPSHISIHTSNYPHQPTPHASSVVPAISPTHASTVSPPLSTSIPGNIHVPAGLALSQSSHLSALTTESNTPSHENTSPNASTIPSRPVDEVVKNQILSEQSQASDNVSAEEKTGKGKVVFEVGSFSEPNRIGGTSSDGLFEKVMKKGKRTNGKRE